MHSLVDTIKYFIIICAELTVLFLAISMLVDLLLTYIPQEKLKKSMAGKGLWGNLVGALIGALTPFCACSTIPMTLGFLQSGTPFGATMSFIISSPLLNPVILTMLLALMGWRVAIVYFVLILIMAIGFGMILEKFGFAGQVKMVRLKGDFSESSPADSGSFLKKLQRSFFQAWLGFRSVLIYLLIGVGAGALIYGYLPQEFVLKFAGPDNPLAIPVAALIGIPLYIRAETAIPIGVALIQKGMSTGAVIALIIGGAGMAIPEMSMLLSIFKKKLVAAIVIVIFLTAVISGYIFNLLV